MQIDPRVRSVGQARLIATRLHLVLLAICFIWLPTLPTLAKQESARSRAFYERAVGEVDQGNLRAAIIELKNSLQLDPDNIQARLLLGNIYLKVGDGASAEKELRAAQDRGAGLESVVLPLGQALLRQGKFEEVLANTDSVPDNSELAYELSLLRADAHAGLRQYRLAQSGYEAAGNQDPNDPRVPLGLARLALVQGNLSDAETFAAVALGIDPLLPDALLVLAEAKRQSGALQEAIGYYRKAQERASISLGTLVRVRLGLAAALIALGRDEEAESELFAIEGIAPAIPLAVYLKALIRMRAGEFDSALSLLESSAPLVENFAPAQYLLGAVHFALGQLETARAWLVRHLQSHPHNLQARKLLGTVQFRLGATQDALATLLKGLDQSPNDPQLLLLVGQAYLRQGHASKASETLRRAAELAPQDPSVLSQLALSQIAQGSDDDALASLNATLDLGVDVSAVGYAVAFAHLRAGAYDNALKIAQNLRQRYPKNAVAANLEGGAYAALGQADRAKDSFREALVIDPQFSEARANLAALMVTSGDLAGARTEYEEILKYDRGNLPALMGLAGLAGHQDDPQARRKWLEAAVASNPEAVRPAISLARHLVALGERLGAVEVLQELLRRHPQNAQALAALGALQIELGNAPDAIETYRRLVTSTEGSVDARSLLAKAQVEAGENEAARETLEAALAADPSHRPSAEALVQLVAKIKGEDSAIEYAEGLRRKYPRQAWGYQLLGDFYWRIGRSEQALGAYQRGWADRPSAGIAIALARAQLHVAKHDSKEARSALDPLLRWLDAHPNDETVRLALADTYLALGDLKRAEEAYEAVKAAQSSNPTVWNNLAWIYQQLGDDRARAHGERAYQLAPKHPAVLDTLGWILLDAGELEEATRLLRQAYMADFRNGDIAYHYASALHRSGNSSEAREILRARLDDDDAFAAYDEAIELLRRINE